MFLGIGKKRGWRLVVPLCCFLLVAGCDTPKQSKSMKDEGRFFLELLEYVRAIQGSIFTLGKHEYVIFATRGVIESPVHLDLFGSLIAWGRRNNINVCSGIGIGVTAFEAEKAAQTAIAHSLERDHGSSSTSASHHTTGE